MRSSSSGRVCLAGAFGVDADSNSLQRHEHRLADQPGSLHRDCAMFLPTVGKYATRPCFLASPPARTLLITAAVFLPETKGKTLEEIEAHFEEQDVSPQPFQSPFSFAQKFAINTNLYRVTEAPPLKKPNIANGCMFCDVQHQNLNGALKMKRNPFRVTFATALAVVLALPLACRKPRTSTKPSAPCAMRRWKKSSGHISRPPTCKEIGCRSHAVITDGKAPKMPSTGQVEAERD